MTVRPALPQVAIHTSFGTITLEIDVRRAPGTARNFLQYVDHGLYAQGSFYRAVGPEGDPNPVPISALQGGLYRSPDVAIFPPIEHEDSHSTGIRHLAGTLSMARDGIGTADSEFFIALVDSPALDAGGARADDGYGFAAFGRVVDGMDVVVAIHRTSREAAVAQVQEMQAVVPFITVRRLGV